MIPARTNTIMIVLVTLTPDTFAASGLEPTANMFLPKTVLFHMNHIIAVRTIEYQTKFGIGVDPIESKLPFIKPV